MFAFSNKVCSSFTCCCSDFTVSVRASTCWRSAATSEAVAEAVGVAVCARAWWDAITTSIVISVLKKNLVIKKSIGVGKDPADEDASDERAGRFAAQKNECAARRGRVMR